MHGPWFAKSLNWLDGQIASGNYATDGYDGPLTWVAERYLYGHLLADGGLVQPGSVFETFFSNNHSTTVGDFETMDQQLQSLFLLDSMEAVQLESLVSQRDAGIDSLTAVEEQLATATGQELEGLLAQRENLIDQLGTAINNLDGFLQVQHSSRLTEAQTLDAQNSAIPVVEAYELNEQAVNTGLLASVLNGGLDSVTMVPLETVAAQCPYSGGTAVFRARSVLAGHMETVFDDSACSPPPQALKRPNGNGNGLSDVFRVHPNPATDGFTLTVGQNEGRRGECEVILTDLHGRILQKRTLHEGSTSMVFETKGLPTGIYFLKVLEKGSTVFSTSISVQ